MNKVLEFADVFYQKRFILEKADSLRSSRLEEELFREEFLAEYHLHCVHVSGDYAQVWISDSKSFYYEGNSEASYMSDSYEIYLVKVNGQWLVFDMFSTDSFDSQYKLADLSAEDQLP